MGRKESVIIVKESHPDIREEQRTQVISEKLAEVIKCDLKIAQYNPA